MLYEDPHLVVLNKPAGLPVHAGPRGGPSVEDMFPQLSRRRSGPWLAHRLDADTAGCLVVALRRAALVAVQAAFAEGRVRKTYWAVVDGTPGTDAGEVDAPLLKRSGVGGWRMVVDPAGAAARTAWRVRGHVGAQTGGQTWLELHPLTGRTHQVRVHCAALGCPVVGDAVYGTAPPRHPGLDPGSRSLAARPQMAGCSSGRTRPGWRGCWARGQTGGGRCWC